MTIADQMVRSSPSRPPVDAATLTACIAACVACAQACTACADACLGEQNVGMLVRCIRLNQDCADLCLATGRVLARQTAFDHVLARAIVESCATACKQCGDECTQHAEHGMEHCRICAETCWRCQNACIELVAALAA